MPLHVGTRAGRHKELRSGQARASHPGMRLLVLVPVLSLLACASASPIPDADRAQLESELTGKSKFLKVSVYKGPFWSDDGKLLLSPAPPTEVALFTDAHGADVFAPPPTGIIPAGRRVRITRVELPTGAVLVGRMPFTPRYNPWVYLAVEGEGEMPGVLVLRANLKSRDQFEAALDRLLTNEDPAGRIAAYAPEIQRAIAQKQVVRDMDPEAVNMAWGPPERRSIDDAKRTESWSYANGKRVVSFSEGKVIRVEQPAATAAPAP